MYLTIYECQMVILGEKEQHVYHKSYEYWLVSLSVWNHNKVSTVQKQITDIHCYFIYLHASWHFYICINKQQNILQYYFVDNYQNFVNADIVHWQLQIAGKCFFQGSFIQILQGST